MNIYMIKIVKNVNDLYHVSNYLTKKYMINIIVIQ